MSQYEAFKLFGLKPAFGIDLARVEAVHQQMMLKVHPDRFADRPAAERRAAEQWSARFNEGLRVLKDPVLRASVLCEAAGFPIKAETNTAMPMDFLMRQMTAREALEAATGDAQALEALLEDAQRDIDADLDALAKAIDQDANYERAVELVRALMFERKFSDEVRHALHAAATQG